MSDNALFIESFTSGWQMASGNLMVKASRLGDVGGQSTSVAGGSSGVGTTGTEEEVAGSQTGRR